MDLQILERVDSILSQMTLEEKVAQMMQIPYAQVGREEALRWARLGAGSFLHVLGEDAREIQRTACANRLGIPVLFGIDAVRGHALNDHATVFPTQLACACAWNPDAMRKMGRIVAQEVAADGLHWTFSPLLCLARDPRWGRTGETFGEDPYLTGELAAALIQGYQEKESDDSERILACAKHYLAYGEAVGARDACDSEITWRKAREVFLPPFQRAVDAGCATFMTAYGSIDGTPLTADRHALKDILRDELGFDGFVVTDWQNVTSLVNKQFAAQDADEAAMLAAEAGNDMMMSSLEFYESAIRLVREKKLDEHVIDEAVRHILSVKLRLGLFEHPLQEGRKAVIGSASHQQAALELARKSITLLKNNGVLPLRKSCRRIALIGGNADDIQAQYGDWTYFTHPLPNPEHEPVRPFSTVREGLEALVQSRGIELTYAYGCGPIPSERDNLDEAICSAKDADVMICVVGDTLSQIGETNDRADLSLSGKQEEMLQRLLALHIPLVTVLVSSKPLTIVSAVEHADAVVAAFNGGAHGGQAIAEALFGCFNPSGRLPISFPRHTGQVPVYYNALPGWHAKSGLGRYCDLEETPLFAFGEGLSYTQFTYHALAVDVQQLAATVQVTNEGSVSGLETVQVYIRDCVSSIMTPVKRLIAFEQVQLNPGESKTLRFQFNRMDFSLVNRNEERVVEPGRFELMVGHSSKDKDLLKVEMVL